MESLADLEVKIKDNLLNLDLLGALASKLTEGDRKSKAKVTRCIERLLQEYWKAEVMQDESSGPAKFL